MAKRHTTDEKVAMVLATLSGEVSHRDLCKRQGIFISQLYLRRKRFLEGARIASERNGNQVSKQVRQPQAENDELKRMLAEGRLVTGFLKRGTRIRIYAESNKETD